MFILQFYEVPPIIVFLVSVHYDVVPPIFVFLVSVHLCFAYWCFTYLSLACW